ncbi:MAG: glucan biosynthesis protein [Isosphaeraceae bacterium]|jgi:surface polysaccharide O-acyltransferase-like enzyme|nr:MAG: glucan biosynthesis protein [Isosphaeraceae bacterium]
MIPGGTIAARRHDLDALRAFAMLLGIGLHAALSLAPIPWIVQDSRKDNGFAWFFQAVHGFRMPLFFLVSGYFTMMLWRRRGPLGMLRQRAMRIALPLVLSAVTILPAMNAISAWAIVSAARRASTSPPRTLADAVRIGDRQQVRGLIAAGGDVNRPDSQFGAPPLVWAALRGDLETTRLLLDAGADPNRSSADRSTALHSAAFFGQAEIVRLLLDRGADVNARQAAGATPLDSASADLGYTQGLAAFLGMTLESPEVLERGRTAVRSLLRERGAIAAVPARASAGGSEALEALIAMPVFHHLWFLWFLCWLVPGFAAVAGLAERLRLPGLPPSMVVSPARVVWLVPLTLLFQLQMGRAIPVFGPDTSAGLLPAPLVLLYYAIFFGYGAVLYNTGDGEFQIGRRWWIWLSVALLVAFPVGVATLGSHRLISAVAQAVYAWAMIFGLIGLFRQFLPRENRLLRYLSDASYWLYLTHLPVVIALQAMVRDQHWPPLVKFALIVSLTTSILLLVYQLGVRSTWVGRLLNGPRQRPACVELDRQGQDTATADPVVANQAARRMPV